MGGRYFAYGLLLYSTASAYLIKMPGIALEGISRPVFHPVATYNDIQAGLHAFHSQMDLVEASKIRARLSKVRELQVDCSHISVIIDSAASRVFSGVRSDFTDFKENKDLKVDGIASGLQSGGTGTIRWDIIDDLGAPRELICHNAVYVPGLPKRLLSPQHMFQEQGDFDESEFAVRGASGIFRMAEGWTKLVTYCRLTNLPIMSCTSCSHRAASEAHLCACVAEEANVLEHLSPKLRRLVKWHRRLGHIPFDIICTKLAGRDGVPAEFKNIRQEDYPKCAACLYGKGKKRSKNKHNAIDKNDLVPGECVSVDQFESRLPGRPCQNRKTKNTVKFVTLFIDHCSRFVFGHFQDSTSAKDTLEAKAGFERSARTFGVSIDGYQADNGTFIAKDFVSAVNKEAQSIKYCGVGAHHQNGIIERAIGYIMSSARTNLIHAQLMWPEGVSVELWPYAVQYAIDVWNRRPGDSEFSPLQLFSRKTSNSGELDRTREHTFGCPVYVLDHQLQGGFKIPAWRPRSRRGVYLGRSPHHSGNVALVLNPRTGNVSPQYHVVFDDEFTTITCGPEKPPPNWTEFARMNSEQLYIDDDKEIRSLDKEWCHPVDYPEGVPAAPGLRFCWLQQPRMRRESITFLPDLAVPTCKGSLPSMP